MKLIERSVLSLAIIVGSFIGICEQSRAAVIVDAGVLNGFNDITAVYVAIPGVIRAEMAAPITNPKVIARLDLGSVQSVDVFLQQNRQDVGSNQNAVGINIYVMSNELLDPTIAANYTEQVFSGNLTPLSNAVSVWRSADITNVTKQYFLLDYTSTFNGALDGVGSNHTYVDFGNVQIQTIPEPSNVMLLGIGITGIAFLLRRRAVANM